MSSTATFKLPDQLLRIASDDSSVERQLAPKTPTIDPAPEAGSEEQPQPFAPAAPLDNYRLDVSIHDSTRIQWVVSAPLAEGGQRRAYDIDFTVDVPEHLWARHEPWQAFHVRTRLQAPHRAVRATRARSVIDDIRHEALRGGRRVKRLERRVEAIAKRGDDPCPGLERLIDDVGQRRAGILLTGEGAPEAVATEARLAAEYLSVELLTAFARLRESLPDTPDCPAVRALSQAIAHERTYRRAQGWPTPRGEGRKGLDRWLRRRSALKKHFHQLLWLDANEYHPDDRLGHWIAALVAIIASTWAFSWHVAYMNQLITGGMSLVSMVMAGAIAGVLYAVKDRIKEVGRRWLSRRVRDGIADKIVHLHLQKRVDSRRGRLLTSRETVRAERTARPDPLNPALGNIVGVMALTVALRLDQHGLDVPGDWGVGGVKHVMRYDLSALLPRLDHGRRDVPITRSDGRVHMASVRKLYGFQVCANLRDETGAIVISRRGELLVDRGGLRRFRPAQDAAK